MSESQLIETDPNEPSSPVDTSAIHEPQPDPNKYKPYKVFINHADTYHSKYIAAHITDQIYGLSKLVKQGGIDEGAPEEPEEVPTLVPVQNVPTDKYEVIGTLSAPYKKQSEDIQYIIDEAEENFKEEILKCGFVIYDITKNPSEIEKALSTLSMLAEELEEIKKIGPKTYEHFNETKIFILISTIMTWGLTKPLDPDDPDLPFSDIDYRKRRPHPNYKKHYACEKEVIKVGQKYKDKLKTYVVCCGNVYGEEEDDFEVFFKMAWRNEVLPIFGDGGNNTVPFINIRDLAKAMHGLMENAPLKPQYILAVEPTPTTLRQFIRSLSKALSDGRTANVVAEEAFLYENMTQTLFERSTVNLNMEPVFLNENLQLEWQSELNVAENMIQIVNDFKKTRNLRPIKIVLHGPPASGKTQLALKLVEYYNSKYVSTSSMLDDYLKIWRENLNKPDEKPKPQEKNEYGEEEEEEEMEEEEQDPAQILEQIREAEILMEGGIDKIPDNYLVGLLRTYLGKNFCQNRGYVLDNYPETTEQAKELFGQAQNLGGEEEEMAELVEPDKILPDIVVSLVACDEFLCDRIMKLPEEEIKGSPYSEDAMIERLEKFRENNNEDNTVLNYFDELEVDILFIEVKDDDIEEKFTLVTDKLGPPTGFGLSPEEEEELRRIDEEARRLALEKEALNTQLMIKQAEEERKNKMESWVETLEKLKLEEEKVLVAQSEPLRHYLMKYVFPTLTKGLIEVATLKPEDPVDFLAEYLFKENPEGKMFDPSYNVECEDLYEEFRGYIEKIITENDDFEK